MNRELTENILKVLRERVRPSSIRDLRHRGFRNVSLLRLNQLDELIREAVTRTLVDLGIKATPRMLRVQGDRVRDELLRLLQERDELQETAERLTEELTELKGNYQVLTERVAAGQRRLEEEEGRTITAADGFFLAFCDC